MLSISELSQDEIKYICKQIPLPMARGYFQSQPKAFAKIRPGFRPDKISDADTLSTYWEPSKMIWKRYLPTSSTGTVMFATPPTNGAISYRSSGAGVSL